jgi:hypothetical protein
MSKMNFNQESIYFWNQRLQETKSVSKVLREIAATENCGKHDAADMLHHVCAEKIQEWDMSVMWNWDFKEVGKGLSDSQLDEKLKHFLEK